MYKLIVGFEKIEEFGNLEMDYVSDFSGGFISKNKNLLEKLDLNNLTQFILEKSVYGTPIFKLGDGGNKILILSGIHGNELPCQIANVNLINELINSELNHTIFFIPFASPKSTMKNERTFNSMDLNRSAHINDSLSNLIVKKIMELGINFVGDFHSTAYNSNPGFEAVFSSKSPTSESFLIANYVAEDVGCEIISFDFAGASYRGAVEDVCNLNGIPSVTCEVLSPFANVATGSVERSFNQMKSFLDYVGI
jgi:predicted deacylase